MTYAFTYEVPIDAQMYRRIMDGVGAERPPGLIAHIAYKTGSGLRYLDVWQTKDDPSPHAPCSTSSTPGPPSTP